MDIYVGLNASRKGHGLTRGVGLLKAKRLSSVQHLTITFNPDTQCADDNK